MSANRSPLRAARQNPSHATIPRRRTMDHPATLKKNESDLTRVAQSNSTLLTNPAFGLRPRDYRRRHSYRSHASIRRSVVRFGSADLPLQGVANRARTGVGGRARGKVAIKLASSAMRWRIDACRVSRLAGQHSGRGTTARLHPASLNRSRRAESKSRAA